jgi:hypothetical protein
MAPTPEQIPHSLLFTILAYGFPTALVVGAICLVVLEVRRLRGPLRGKPKTGKANSDEEISHDKRPTRSEEHG